MSLTAKTIEAAEAATLERLHKELSVLHEENTALAAQVKVLRGIVVQSILGRDREANMQQPLYAPSPGVSALPPRKSEVNALLEEWMRK